MTGMTIWSYKPLEWTGERRGNVHVNGQDFLYSGIGTAEEEVNVENWIYAVLETGHAITVPYDFWKPWNHHIIGCGVGHDDAEFAETGRSMAAYYENEDPWGGRWWESPYGAGRKYYTQEA